MPLQLQTASLEDLLCSQAPLSSDAASPGCVTSSQVPFKAFLSPAEPRAPQSPDRKLSPLLSPLQDPLVDKSLLEPREMVRPKKVCFSASSLPLGDRTRRSYYLNGMAGGGHLWAQGSGRQSGRPAGHSCSIHSAQRGPGGWGAGFWGCICSNLLSIEEN